MTKIPITAKSTKFLRKDHKELNDNIFTLGALRILSELFG